MALGGMGCIRSGYHSIGAEGEIRTHDGAEPAGLQNPSYRPLRDPGMKNFKLSNKKVLVLKTADVALPLSYGGKIA